MAELSKKDKGTVFLLLPRLCYGGQERFVSRLSEMLADDYDVYVIVFDASDNAYQVKGTLVDLKSSIDKQSIFVERIIHWLAGVIKFRQLLKDKNPLASFSFGLQADILNILSKRKGIKTITSIRGYLTAETICNRKLFVKLYKRSDMIVCVSKQIQDLLRDKMELPESRGCVIYNGFDVENIKKLAVAEQSAQPQAYPRIIAVGTLKREKGYWHLIKAVYCLKKTYSHVQLKILGDDYKGYSQKINQLISELELSENVELAGWKELPYPDIAASDIFVLSSVREGFPNVLVEAMACGRPVIAADCPSGPREILRSGNKMHEVKGIEDSDYGILVEKLSEQEDFSTQIDMCDRILSDAINKLISDKKLSAYYSKRSLERAAEFSYGECRKEYEKLLF